MTLRLTVIDQTPVHGDRSPVQACAASVELAMLSDTLGYHRYWLAEHHDSIQFAGPAPEILLARIASATQKMRIGSGGVMLTHYSPYKVAETFALLGALFPGRIDLGIGRAPGGSQLSSFALAAPGGIDRHDHFPQQAADLCGFLRGTLPADHPYASLQCLTDQQTRPQLWMLGSGGGSAGLAGQLGMGLALARFIAPRTCSPQSFQHHAQTLSHAGYSGNCSQLLALAVICAETDEEARHIAGTAAYRKMMTGRGHREPLLAPDEVERRYQRMALAERHEFDRTLEEMVVGCPATCHREIQRLALEFGCQEIGLVSVTHAFTARLTSYQLLASVLT